MNTDMTHPQPSAEELARIRIALEKAEREACREGIDVMDPDAMDRYRVSWHDKNGHDMAPINYNSLRRLCALIDHLAFRLQSDGAKGEEGWRPEVRAFADLMEAQLKANDHKPGWKSNSTHYLWTRFCEESDNLCATLMTRSETDKWRLRMKGEVADVANFAMMIADVCGALASRPTTPEAWRPISEVGSADKITGWCTYPAGASARYCELDHLKRWMASGCSQIVTHFKPWPVVGPPPPSTKGAVG